MTSSLRERIARVIDPEAFDYFDGTPAGQRFTADLLRHDAWRQSALAKADAIRALLQKLKAGVSPYAGEREGGGRQTINDPQCADEGTQEPSLAPGAGVTGAGGEP